jgi:hypothetical protein
VVRLIPSNTCDVCAGYTGEHASKALVEVIPCLGDGEVDLALPALSEG